MKKIPALAILLIAAVSLAKAVGVFDAFIESQKKNGLLHVRYDQNYAEDHLKNIPANVCNLGWGGIMPADLYELSALTGNPMWERIARLMWANAYRLWTLDRLHNRGITLK